MDAAQMLTAQEIARQCEELARATSRRGGGVVPDGQTPDGQTPDGRLRPVEAVTEPMLQVVQPETGRPGVDQPGGAGPGRGERAGAGPVRAQPRSVEPNGAEPNGAGPNGAGPNGAGPNGVEPNRAGSSRAELRAEPQRHRECIGRKRADREPAERELSEQEPAEQEQGILAFERQWWKRSGGKDRAIRELFGMSGARYYQVLNELLDDPAAVRSDPMLIKRLRKLRASRQRARQARRLGIEWH